MKTLKKLVKSPIVIVLIAVIAIGVGFSLINQQGDTEVTTEQGLAVVKDQKLKEVTIVSGDNRVNVQLEKPHEE